MDDLVAFLQARLGEEYQFAHRFVYVDGGDWTAEELARLWWYSDPPKSRSASDPIIQHAAHYSPARAFRQAEAMRVILDEHAPSYPVTYPEPSGQPTCGVCHSGGFDWDPEGWPCATVRALAAVYSDHPDYRAEWKP